MGNPDAALHPLGVFSNRSELGVLEPDHVQKLVDASFASLRIEPEQLRVIIERFTGVEERVEIALFGEISDPLLDGHIGGRFAKYRNATARGLQEPEDELDRRAFA